MFKLLDVKNVEEIETLEVNDDYIQKVLSNNEIFEVDEISNPDDIKFRKYTTTIYRNEYEKENKYIWFEHSWGQYRGIHEYSSEKELLLDVKNKFIDSHDVSSDAVVIVYEYEKPEYHLSCLEFYKYCESQKIINLNKPLYFYHVINKDAVLDDGIYSLKYMYDNGLFELFDKSTKKYKLRIVNDWNIEKYKDRKVDSLTREEIMDALNIFRGEYGSRYIYFFRYPLYKELGSRMAEILKYKDIYRIDINDERIQKYIVDIFYGYDLSNSDNKVLDRSYYENVTCDEYFKKYDEYEFSVDMSLSTIEHMTYEERRKYFSSVRINPNDLERLINFGTQDALRILNYLFDSSKLWADGFDEADGLNREFRLVESKSQIPERAVKLPSSVFNSWELYYDTVSVREQIPEKACFIEKEMLDVYKKWNGLYNIALYYVLVK